MMMLLSFFFLALTYALEYVVHNIEGDAALHLSGNKLLEWYPNDLKLVSGNDLEPLSRGMELKAGDVLLQLRNEDDDEWRNALAAINFGLLSWAEAPSTHMGFFFIGASEAWATRIMSTKRWLLPAPPALREYDYGLFPQINTEAPISLLKSVGDALGKKEVCNMNLLPNCKPNQLSLSAFKGDRAVTISQALNNQNGSLLDVFFAWRDDIILQQILRAALKYIRDENESLFQAFLGRVYVLNFLNCESEECLELGKQLAGQLFPANVDAVNWEHVAALVPIMTERKFLKFEALIEKFEQDVEVALVGRVMITEENFDSIMSEVEFELDSFLSLSLVKAKDRKFDAAQVRARKLVSGLLQGLETDRSSGIEIFERLSDVHHGEHEIAKFIVKNAPKELLAQVQFSANANSKVRNEATALFDPRTPVELPESWEMSVESLMHPTIAQRLAHIASSLLPKNGVCQDLRKLRVSWYGESKKNAWCRGLENWILTGNFTKYDYDTVAPLDPNLKCLVWDGKEKLKVKSASESLLQLVDLKSLQVLPFTGRIPANHALAVDAVTEIYDWASGTYSNVTLSDSIDAVAQNFDIGSLDVQDNLLLLLLYIKEVFRGVLPFVVVN